MIWSQKLKYPLLEATGCGQQRPIAGGVTSFGCGKVIRNSRDGLRVVETDPDTDPRWEPFIRTHPDGTIYHHPAWLKALEQEYGQKAVHLACEDDDGQLLAVLALLYTRGLPFNLGGAMAGRRLSSLPRTPLGGPLSKHREAMAAIVRAAVSLTSQNPGIQLQIKTQGTELDGLVDGVVRTPWRDSYLLELPEDPAKLRFGNNVMRHRIKWAVNKATKLGLQVRVAENEEDLRAWYGLYLDAMRRNTVAARSYRFFQSLWHLLYPKGLMRLLIAERIEGGQRRLLAGSVFFMYGRTVSYAFTGCKREDLSLHPNDLIQWHAIHDACGKGFHRYDFGEVPEDHQQVANFKSKWGAEPVPLYRYYYPAPRVSPSFDGTPIGRIRRLTAAAWRRMPLRTTALLGDWIYSHL